jgi:type I restriction enzyme S subunit
MSNKAKATDMKEDGKPALTPKLRFPEFRDATGWDTTPGDELFEQITNRQATAGLPILAITQEHGAIPRDLIDYHVSVTDKSVETYKEVRPGDFIISLRSFQGGIEYSSYHGICSPAYVILRKRTELSDLFFKQHFKSHSFIQQLTKNLEGLRDGKMVSYKQFSELLLLNPPHPEQQKIAECLCSVDELMAAQTRKLGALKTHKKGLMQQLFPCEGETQPRLRFPEFQNAGDWAEEKLGNIVEIWSGYSPSKYALSNIGKYAFVKVEDLNNCIKYQADSREYCDDSDDAVPRNSVLFPKRGASIELNKIRITALEILIDTNLMAITPDGAVTVEFLYYFLVNEGLAQIADMSTIPQINNKHIIPFKILLPSKLEQESIADGLTSLDDLIAAQTQKLEALKTHKKGLMQQLFPYPEEFEA